MKYLKIFLFLFVLSSTLLNATDLKLGITESKPFIINPDINEPLLKFTSSAPLEEIVGYVKDVKDIISNVTLDASNIEKMSGKISFPVENLKTGISTRDGHLYSEDWLNAEKYKYISFTIKEVKYVKVLNNGKAKADVELTINGDFGLHGKTKNMDVVCKMTYLKESSKTKKRADGDLLFIEGSFDIALADYNVKGVGDIVGSKVGETIQIEFKLFYNSK